MTDDLKQGPDDANAQQDDRLVNELDSLYQRVASADSAENDPAARENTDRYYKVLQLHPGVSMPEIRIAYEKMVTAWDPGRYPHVPSWKETSAEKLKEIENAYERLLLLHEGRGTDEPRGAAKRPLPKAIPSFEEDADAEETVSVGAGTAGHFGPAFRFRPWLLAAGALIAIILILFFLWPTFYHYETVRLGGKDYPLRINRLTTHAQYFDGRRWIEPPIRVETPRRIPSVTASAPLPAPLPVQPPVSGPGPGSEPGPIPQPPAKEISPQAPSPVRSSRIVIRDEQKPVPSPAVKKITARDQNRVNKKTAPFYSIQVCAYPEKNKADALAREMQAKKLAVRVEAVSIPGRGQWYRVLLGEFGDRETALRYLKDHRIGESYPGSFIQRVVSG